MTVNYLNIIISKLGPYSKVNVISFILLGFCAGLPLPLIGATMSAHLMEAGINYTSIGLFALAGTPYALKFIWSPFVDTLKIPFLYKYLGKRKSWAAADASKRAIELATISQLNDEVYKSIQNDKNWGFEKTYLNESGIKFGKELNDWVIQNVLFKVLFPAEFHGQSAVEGAIKLSKEFNQNIDKVNKINIFTHEPAIRIISNKENLSNASDRDHSLEYMVSAALLFGELKYEMYGDDFSGLNKIESLRKKIFVSEDSNFTENYYEFSKRHISNSIEIVYDDNSTSEKITIENPIGHPSRREEAIPLLKEKFIRNVQNVLSSEKSISLWEQVINLQKDDELTKFFNILQDDE